MGAEMRPKVTSLIKFLLTNCAFERLFSSVGTQVNPQVTCLGELLLANRALKFQVPLLRRLMPQTDVRAKTTPLIKLPLANGALIRLLPRVDPKVRLQVIPFEPFLLANRAFERPLPWVGRKALSRAVLSIRLLVVHRVATYL